LPADSLPAAAIALFVRRKPFPYLKLWTIMESVAVIGAQLALGRRSEIMYLLE
jgi:hypothetical protein